MFEEWHRSRIPEMIRRSKAAGFIYRYWRGNAKDAKGQCKRSSVPANTPLLYYKRSNGIPFIDTLLQKLQNRFSADNCRPVSTLLSLIPSLVVKLGMHPKEQFESWHDGMLAPRSLDNEILMMVQFVVQAIWQDRLTWYFNEIPSIFRSIFLTEH